jgi:hypothetical protein
MSGSVSIGANGFRFEAYNSSIISCGGRGSERPRLMISWEKKSPSGIEGAAGGKSKAESEILKSWPNIPASPMSTFISIVKLFQSGSVVLTADAEEALVVSATSCVSTWAAGG